MKLTILRPVEFFPVTLIISAHVRYWEDATINGVADEDGTLIPFRNGDVWEPHIDLAAGRVIDWPDGTTASIHYKVCDEGDYWLRDAGGRRAKYRSFYVPDALLCHGDRGYGDYIILNIDGTGKIADWKTPELDGQDWEFEEAVQ